jgi:hypothetical protein
LPGGGLMNGTKLIVSAAMVVGLGVAAACSSSSGGAPADAGTTPEDVGTHEEAGPDVMSAATCNPLLGILCGAGETCCSSGLQGTCVAIGSCGRPFQVSCIGKANCAATGGTCCGAVSVPAGFDASAAFDASGGFDASGFGLTLACESTCSSSEFQVCSTTNDCPSGQVCEASMGSPLLACVLVDAGITPDAGNGALDGGEAGVPEAGSIDAGDGG